MSLKFNMEVVAARNKYWLFYFVFLVLEGGKLSISFCLFLDESLHTSTIRLFIRLRSRFIGVGVVVYIVMFEHSKIHYLFNTHSIPRMICSIFKNPNEIQVFANCRLKNVEQLIYICSTYSLIRTINLKSFIYK